MTADKYIIHDPAGPDIEFEGEVVAEGQGADIGNVKIYRTGSGQFVAEQRRSAFRGYPAIDRAGVFGSLQDLSIWLGYSNGAKAILEKLGHPTRKKID